MQTPWPWPASALIALVPEVDSLVDRCRDALGVPADGMPPHVTVLFPWLAPGEFGTDDLEQLAAICAAVPAFEVTFAEFGRFATTLWLAPSPADPFVRLTLAVGRAWPDHPPYGDRFPSIVPHLPIGGISSPVEPGGSPETGADDEFGHVVANVAAELPVSAFVREVALMVRDESGPWRLHSSYELGRP